MVSTRNHDKNVTYSVGDRVEIVRPGSLEIGVILSKVKDAAGRESPSSASTHWLVSVEGNLEEEEFSERYLGRVLPPRDEEEEEGAKEEDEAMEEAPPTTRSTRNKKTSGSSSGRRSPRINGSNSSGSGNGNGRKPPTRRDSKASTTTDEEGEDDKAGDNSSGTEEGRSSRGGRANKARGSARHDTKAHKKGGTQAKISNNTAVARRYATRRGKGEGEELFEGIDKVKNNSNSKKKARVPTPKPGPDETVIKVKMLTGTLYLYRGSRPRAEFVRVV